MRTTQNVAESCLAAEAKVSRAQQTLAEDARPETVDQCVAELAEVADLLRGLTKDSFDADAFAILRGIHNSVQRLSLQIEHASRLCRGWIQRRLGTGYTAQGAPVLMPPESETLFEA
ncbi:MAG TPA: hypothetical protein VGN17_09870 [Bryobacteraceae bacterium]|jgi:hypothetical protein